MLQWTFSGGRKEGKGNGRKKKRRGNSDNARFHISLEKMNEPVSLSHPYSLLLLELLLATNLKMGTVMSGYFDRVAVIGRFDSTLTKCVCSINLMVQNIGFMRNVIYCMRSFNRFIGCYTHFVKKFKFASANFSFNVR